MICETQPVLLICNYCPLRLFCSATCALLGYSHPCNLASKLVLNLFIPLEEWHISMHSLKYLDQLFTFPIKCSAITLLLNHGICFSSNALTALSTNIDTTFVWPHEQKEHHLWLKVMACRVKYLWHGSVPAPLCFEWAKRPVLFFPLLSTFVSINTANAILPLLDQTKICNLVITTESGLYEMLYDLIALADIPFLYHTFHAIVSLQLTRDNMPSLFFPDERGRHILLPTLNKKSWLKAIQIIPVFPYKLCCHKNRWLRGKQEYIFFLKRKQNLLNLFISRNPYFEPYLKNIPPLQAWTFD